MGEEKGVSGREVRKEEKASGGSRVLGVGAGGKV